MLELLLPPVTVWVCAAPRACSGAGMHFLTMGSPFSLLIPGYLFFPLVTPVLHKRSSSCLSVVGMVTWLGYCLLSQPHEFGNCVTLVFVSHPHHPAPWSSVAASQNGILWSLCLSLTSWCPGGLHKDHFPQQSC